MDNIKKTFSNILSGICRIFPASITPGADSSFNITDNTDISVAEKIVTAQSNKKEQLEPHKKTQDNNKQMTAISSKTTNVPQFLLDNDITGIHNKDDQSPPEISFDLTPDELNSITLGKPFPPNEAEYINYVAGAPLTQEGLTKLYAGCMPDTNVCYC